MRGFAPKPHGLATQATWSYAPCSLASSFFARYAHFLRKGLRPFTGLRPVRGASLLVRGMGFAQACSAKNLSYAQNLRYATAGQSHEGATLLCEGASPLEAPPARGASPLVRGASPLGRGQAPSGDSPLRSSPSGRRGFSPDPRRGRKGSAS